MNVKNCTLILVAMLFMTSACGTAPPATPTATLAPTSTPRPTDTPFPTRPRLTPTPRPTATRRPTVTPDLNGERQRQIDAIFSTLDLPDPWVIFQVDPTFPQGYPGIRFSTAQMMMQGPVVRSFFEVDFWEDQSSFYSHWLMQTNSLGLTADEESLPESDTLYSFGQNCDANQAMDPQYPCTGTLVYGWSFVEGGNREYMVIWANTVGETEEHAHIKAGELVEFILNALDAMFSAD